MGITKTEIFSNTQNKFSILFKVLGNPARVAILEYLMNVDSCICGDITQEVGLAQPTVSQHLKELRNAGLIKGSINGNSICYCIDKMHWKRARKMINSFMKKDIIGLKNCC